MTVKEVGNWHEFNVDLRAYQGQDIYVAIVHYNSTNQFMVNVDEKRFNVNVSELPAGTYLIKMTSEGLVQTQRFVKR